MIHRQSIRALLTSAALVSALALAGCTGDELSPNAKASKPIPEKLLAEIADKNMDKESPILVRIFKQEAELEVWKKDRAGQFALLKTYPICRWSGELGPKIREGDRQAPEGFYSITPGQMNPQSAYYLSFDTGYPNAFDKALGRTGSQLMVHGDCSSRGCYAMTDEQISEIYALGRESFFGGQRSFQLQAYPFRMTPQNMARHRNNPNMAFWKMIKQGYDHFEVTRQEPKVDVCEKHYVFDAQSTDGKPLKFSAAGKCPAYDVAPEVAEAVQQKQRDDEFKTAQLISSGRIPAAPVRTGIDGGMHPAYAARIGASPGNSSSGEYSIASYSSVQGTVPTLINPPKAPEQPIIQAAEPTATPSIVRAGAPAPKPEPKSESAGFFDRVAKSIGLGKDEPAPVAAPAKPTTVAVATPKPRPVEAKSEPKPELKPAIAAKPAETKPAEAKPAVVSAAPATITGATPIVTGNSFDSRWSAFR